MLLKCSRPLRLSNGNIQEETNDTSSTRRGTGRKYGGQQPEWMDGEGPLSAMDKALPRKHELNESKACPSNSRRTCVPHEESRSNQVARDNGTLMLSLPPHTTHRMQPLDRTFYKPLMTNYNAAADRWMRSHAGRAITMYQICSLFGEAYKKTATMTTATNGFSCSGIWPCNRDIFTDTDYAADDRFVEDKDHSPEDAPAPQQSPVIHEQSPAPCVAELAPATPESSQRSTANPATYPVVAEQASDANTSVVNDERSILPGVAAPATLESTQRSTAIPGPYPVVAEQSLDTSTSSVDGERLVLFDSPGCDSREYRIIRTNGR